MIVDKIDKITESLDGIIRAEAKPFLHTRVLARMHKNEELTVWDQVIFFLSRPAVITACVFLFIAINTAIVFSSNNDSEHEISISSVANSQADFANMGVNNIYDFENIEP